MFEPAVVTGPENADGRGRAQRADRLPAPLKLREARVSDWLPETSAPPWMMPPAATLTLPAVPNPPKVAPAATLTVAVLPRPTLPLKSSLPELTVTLPLNDGCEAVSFTVPKPTFWMTALAFVPETALAKFQESVTRGALSCKVGAFDGPMAMALAQLLALVSLSVPLLRFVALVYVTLPPTNSCVREPPSVNAPAIVPRVPEKLRTRLLLLLLLALIVSVTWVGLPISPRRQGRRWSRRIRLSSTATRPPG